MLIFAALLLVTGAAISEHQACHFVGSRFVGITSECEAGYCSDMTLPEDGSVGLTHDLPGLACDEAVRIVEAFFFREQQTAPRISQRLRQNRTEELLNNIQTFLISSLDVLSVGGGPPLDDMAANLTQFHDLSLQTASANWPKWISEVVPSVLNSDLYTVVDRQFSEMFTMTKRCSYLSSHRRDVITGMINFYFDFAALMGVHVLGRGHLSCLSKTVRFAMPLHRAVDTLDSRWGERRTCGVPDDAGSVVELSRVIENIA